MLIFQPSELQAQKSSKIEIKHADFLRSDKKIREGARRLVGNVRFWQDSTIMECDSAYFMGEKNWFEAYGKVHLYKEGDSKLDVRSKFLRYNGNTKMAYFRKNVVLRDTQVVLFTDSLDYDIRKDIGYYLYNAQIVDSATTLTSKKGYYYHKKQAIYFKEKVIVNQNKGEYQMYTDTLKYDTKSKIAFFFGPTEFYNDSNYMYAEYGFYQTKQNKAFFKNNAFYSNPKQSIEADSLFYDRDKEHGIAYSNVVATDTAQKIIVKGNYLEVFKKTEQFFVTDSALLMSIMEGDTLYLHADTIYANYDTTNTYRIFRAFHHTKIFKSNFQAKTDSLCFSMADSIIRFYGSPILWAEQNQITSTYIEAFVVNEKLDRFKLYNGGLIVSMEDSLHFNQIKGTEMTGYLKNNHLSKIDVSKKSETIYFPTDEFGIIGINKSTSTDITLYFKKNKESQKDAISRIIYRDNPDATMYPLTDVAPNDMKVKNFAWHNNWRPLIPTDVFIWEGNSPQLIKIKLKKDTIAQPKLDYSHEE
jgi:lipopolysaccharide export system protein LptA